MDNNYSLSDIASVANGMDGFGGGNAWFIVILFLLIANGGFGGDYGRFATAASQQEILFGQQFQNLDNKMDRLGNGIADSTFALNNAIVNGTQTVAGTVVAEGRGLSDKLCTINSAIHDEGEKTRAMFMQNKVETLQQKVAELEMRNNLCGVVRYPTQSMWAVNGNPFCNCNCGTL